jgi:hypothetical protein
MAEVAQQDLSSLAKRVARALGARKVLRLFHEARRMAKVAGYELDSRYLKNPLSQSRFDSSRPVLSPAQSRVVQDLNTRGIALLPFSELFGDQTERFWPSFERFARDFVASDRVRREIEAYQTSADFGKVWKDYLIQDFGTGKTLRLDNPVLRIGLAPEIVDTVNSYLGLWSELRLADLWYTIPSQQGRERSASQRWHRDPNDRRLVKVFLYVNEVDDSAGPLEYIPGSRAGGPYEYLWPLADGAGVYEGSYPPQEKVEAAVPAQDRVICTCPPATLVFCDTSGFHRGGYAFGRERLLGTWMYVTPASRTRLDFHVSDLETASDLIPAARAALRSAAR